MKQARFYATRPDLLALVDEIDQRRSLRYVLSGNFLSRDFDPTLVRFDSGREIPDIGVASADSSMACKSYLVQSREASLKMREIEGFEGARVCIDQLLNPDSITLTPGGTWEDDVLLQGRVATASMSEGSSSLMHEFRRGLKRHFRAINGYYLGPEATELHRGGMRLTASVGSPREYDFCF